MRDEYPQVVSEFLVGDFPPDILEKLVKRSIPGVSDYICIDSNIRKPDMAALRNEQEFPANSVRKLKWGDRGFLETFFQDADVVLLVAELEVVRTGELEIIAELAKTKGAFTVAFVIIPVGSESTYSNSRTAVLEDVRSKIDGIMFIPGVDLRCDSDGSLMLPSTEDMIRTVDNAVVRRIHALATMLSNPADSMDIVNIRSMISRSKLCHFGWGTASSGEPGYLAQARVMTSKFYFDAYRRNGALIMLVVNPHGLSKQRRDYIEHLKVTLPEKRSDFIVRLFHDERMAQDELLMNIFSS